MANLSCVWDTMLTQGEVVRAVQKAATEEAEEAEKAEEAVGMMLGMNLLGKLEEPRIYVCCELRPKTIPIGLNGEAGGAEDIRVL